MTGEIITEILAPKEEDWFVLCTDQRSYSIRLGGISLRATVKRKDYETVDLPLMDRRIRRYYTDGYTVYIELDSGEAIQHAPDASIDGDGTTYFGLFFLSSEAFAEVKLELREELYLIEPFEA
jgi:hypothetical protein